MKYWKKKNEKFLFDIQRKCSDIANEILNAATDAERTFKCNLPEIEQNKQKMKKSSSCLVLLKIENMECSHDSKGWGWYLLNLTWGQREGVNTHFTVAETIILLTAYLKKD